MTEQDHNAPARRAHAAVIGAVAIAVAGAATATTLLLTTGGSSPARPPTAAQAARQQARQASRALNVTRAQQDTTSRVPQLRLGLLASPADATGLVAIRLGYIAAKLSPSGTQLIPTTYTTPAAEGAALASGAIDAAYLTPAAATSAWQKTRHAIRIIAGADQTTTGTPEVVLAICSAYLASHASATTDLLQGDIQATTLLITGPALALAAARAELQTLAHHKISKSVASSFSRYQSTNSPGQPAATAGIFDLTPVNTLLRASGFAPA